MKYLQAVQQLLTNVEDQQPAIERASDIAVKAIRSGGILQLFGCGHSQLIAQEGFYRAGGLACVKPVSIEPLMLHYGALRSSQNEKALTDIEAYWAHVDLQPQDVLFVISTSGRNAVPVEFAIRAKQQGIPVITLQSLYYREQSSRHPSGQRLEDVSDVVIDTKVPVGDGIITTDGGQFGPVSTVVATSLLNELFVAIIDALQQHDEALPIFESANVKSHSASNEHWLAHYRERIQF